MNNEEYGDNIKGTALTLYKGTDIEPVLPPVAEKDAEETKKATNRLRCFLERINRLQQEKKDIQNDIAAIFAEAKSAGYDVKAMRAVLKLAQMGAADRDEQDFLIDSYRLALGI